MPGRQLSGIIETASRAPNCACCRPILIPVTVAKWLCRGEADGDTNARGSWQVRATCRPLRLVTMSRFRIVTYPSLTPWTPWRDTREEAIEDAIAAELAERH